MTGEKIILIVDDEPVISDAIATDLKARGFDAIIAADGMAAIENTRQYKPALILLDLHIPKLGGLRVCEILKDDIGTKDIPIVILSAVDSQDTKETAYKLGVEDFLVKPFKLNAIWQRISGYLEEVK